MKLLIAAIGKAKAGPEQQLYQDYARRLPWKIICRELIAKSDDPSKRKTKEGELLLAACGAYEKIIALDEGGKTLSSREFAQALGNWQSDGASSFAFIIGGADGLSDVVLKRAHLRWSLGRVTWPHMLVRALLAEQLYRAHSVLTNHPYHRD
jgi:23S rRNA (pseudouridine1915-N3)-methyltransferase